MGDRIPVGKSGSSYSGQILGTDENNYVRKVKVNEEGVLKTEIISSPTQPTTIIDIANYKVHSGEAFAINIVDFTPDANGAVNCVITAGIKDVHILIEGMANAGGIFRTFGLPTFTGGVSCAPFNRIIGEATSNAAVLSNVIGLSGDTRGDLPILGSSGFFSTSGGSRNSGFESVLKAGDSLGIEVETNTAGEPIGIIVDFYEVEPN